MKEFVEVPNAKLGNWAPCPYARKARLDKQIEIVQGESLFNTTDINDQLSLIFTWN